MIIRIIIFSGRLSTNDNSPGTAIACSLGFYRKFVIIPALLFWQHPLIITKNGAVF